MEIGKLELICERNHSKIYKEILNEQIYCLKEYKIWSSCSLEMMIKSYKNYQNLVNKEGLVKIYNFWFEENIVFIRMEYLENYITFSEWLEQKKQITEIIKKIINIITNLLIQNCISFDCGDGNFMVNEQLDVKLIDLDLLNNYDLSALSNLGQHYKSWFHRLLYSQEHKGKL